MPPCDPFGVSAPASSANLGPGFDAVGIALELRLRARVVPAKRFELSFAPGEHAPSHDGLGEAIVRAMRHVDPDLPRVHATIENAIPLGKGLGSSAAATVVGIAIAMRARGGAPLQMREIARLACEIEGHPDNALPAVYGGAVIAASCDANAHVRVRAPRDLAALVVVPDFEFPTARARELLPASYDRSDVVFTAQRAALLGAALASGSWNELGEAMRDRVHQPYRAPRIPGMSEALALRERGVIGSALSGAGPSLIALLRPRAVLARIAAAFEACFTRAGVAANSLALSPAGRGLCLARG